MEEFKGKSIEQISEKYYRDIREKKGALLEAFFLAYADQLSLLGKEFSLDDICLIEQEGHYKENCLTRRYWFEFKPKFED